MVFLDSFVRREISRIETFSRKCQRRITLSSATSITPLLPLGRPNGTWKRVAQNSMKTTAISGSVLRATQHDHVSDKCYAAVSIDAAQELIRLTSPDPSEAQNVWDQEAIAESLKQCASLLGQDTAYVYVDRERDLVQARRETQGIL